MPQIKALTLWQPWASLIAWGEKQYETRSWSTQYRGLLAIHAATAKSHLDPWWISADHAPFYSEALARRGVARPLDLPRGGVLCIVRLTHVYRTADLRSQISAKEASFGDFSDGRAAWQIELLRVFDQPIPTRGKQGLWTFEYSPED